MRRFRRRAAGVLLAAGLILGLIAAPAPGGAAEQVPELGERAELQRLLTQRIARAYCQAGLGIAPTGSGQELLESVALFDLQLTKLKQSSLQERERAALVAVEQSWAPLRAATLRRFTRDGCDSGSAARRGTAALSADLARELSGRSGARGAGTPVAMAAKQQVLAQKLARLYMVCWRPSGRCAHERAERHPRCVYGAFGLGGR